MANSDKNILITPNVGSTTSEPLIRFTGANNTPTTLRVLDDGTVSFEATAGQLLAIKDGLSGSIYSVNDISGIPSFEILDTGLVKFNQYNGSTVFGGSSALTSTLNSASAILSITPRTTTSAGLVVRAIASQTGNLSEWQNSASTVVVTISGDGVFHAPLVINPQTGTTYTFALSDAGKSVEVSNASPITVTVPLNSSVAFLTGTQINILQTGAGQITVAGAAGVTVNGTPGLKLRTQWSSATLIKRSTDTWVLVGDLAS